MAKAQRTSVERDTATLSLKHVVLGGGVFDNTGEHPNKKGWDIFELGQKSFWAVPTAVDWSVPVREDPEYADAIASMLAFLAPGEKAAVHGAAMISLNVQSEEAKFYFVEQSLEEAKHFDALRRLYGKIAGKPLGEPSASLRLLYSFGVIDPDDVAFMIGSINIIGEHLAHQIFHQINHVAKDETVRKVLALIGKDESRHIAAGQRFFPEVYAQFRKNRHRIMAKNLATTVVLLAAGYEMVNPMRKLDIDLAKILEAMYQHYEEVTDGLPAFPEQGVFDVLMSLLRKSTPGAVAVVHKVTGEGGRIDSRRLVHLCETALKSPRALREMFAA